MVFEEGTENGATKPTASARLDSRRAAKPSGGIAVVALGGVILLGAVVGAAFVARAVRRARGGSAASLASEPLISPPASPERAMGGAMAVHAARQLAYWCLKAVAVTASWLARLARPVRN